MNKLKGDCFIGHDTSILLYKYSWIYNIPSCRQGTRLDMFRLQEGINVYTLVKLYSKANLLFEGLHVHATLLVHVKIEWMNMCYLNTVRV